MSEQRSDMPPQLSGGEEERKPVVFAVRIDPALREQVEGIRGITEQSVNEVGVEALIAWVDNKLADEDVREKAMAGIEEEERRIKERKAAIQGILEATTSK
ncbi:hypothetical protein FNQ90_00870 [Streptomyces alkaliphilus]|uniref:Uncharacterized protein n=1 Tax=Streptomyces alkaliphilus TaxID=1472722 RepID=A0A7W3XZZ9_9ACTN|nr:hypothetical protein [Streptomyces alkaliphilus]MBB0242695.1 hypothetical protein [Streptomyces alkaliphilus]